MPVNTLIPRAQARAVRALRSIRQRRKGSNKKFATNVKTRGGKLQHQELLSKYQLSDSLFLDDQGRVPVRWWIVNANFGDLLSPWLVRQMTGREVVLADRTIPHYLVIGSVAKRARKNSVLWGTGSFGIEDKKQLRTEATYTAVRGPLTRARLQHFGADVPAVYGDPALLAPAFFFPKVDVVHEVGMVTRWSERNRANAEFGPGIHHITLDTDDIEGTIRAILSCKRIVTSSLHGLIIADAYGIPSAWLASKTPAGGEFKFYDYFATVHKYRKIQRFSFTRDKVTVSRVLRSLHFDDEPIHFNWKALLDACPFLEPKK